MIKYDPQKDPSYHAALKFVAENGDQMKFNSEAERKDYEKGLSIPGNVRGIPHFIPAIPMTTGFSDIRGSKECKVDGCGGCCIATDGYKCPRCGTDNSQFN